MSDRETVSIPERPIEFATKALALAVRHDVEQLKELELQDEAALDTKLDQAKVMHRRGDSKLFALIFLCVAICIAGVTGLINRMVPPWVEYSIMASLFFAPVAALIIENGRKQRVQAAIAELKRCHQLYMVAIAIRSSTDAAVVTALASGKPFRTPPELKE